MNEHAGSILHLRKMAARCRGAARQAPSRDEARALLALAGECEDKAEARELAAEAAAGGPAGQGRGD